MTCLPLWKQLMTFLYFAADWKLVFFQAGVTFLFFDFYQALGHSNNHLFVSTGPLLLIYRLCNLETLRTNSLHMQTLSTCTVSSEDGNRRVINQHHHHHDHWYRRTILLSISSLWHGLEQSANINLWTERTSLCSFAIASINGIWQTVLGQSSRGGFLAITRDHGHL